MTDISYALFKKYLRGLCTPEEIRQIEEWIHIHPAYFDKEMMQELLLQEQVPLPANVEKELAAFLAALPLLPAGTVETDNTLLPAQISFETANPIPTQISFDTANAPIPADISFEAAGAPIPAEILSALATQMPAESPSNPEVRASAPVRLLRLPWLTRTRAEWMGAAAIVLLIAISPLLWILHRDWQQNDNRSKYAAAASRQWTAPAGSQKRIVLPDSSIVTLFPGTNIRIPNDFNEHTRDLQLDGRAYFDITRDPGKPFRVHTPDLTTNVLGTTFEIDAADSAQVNISVCTGLVSISRGERELTRLSPNQQVRFGKATGLFTVRETDAARLCRWTTGQLAFENTPLPEICQTLQKWYGIPFSLDEKKWQDKKVSVTFEGQSVATVLEILSITAGFQYTITPNKIIIN